MPLYFFRRSRLHGRNWPANINSFRVHRFQRPYIVLVRSPRRTR